MLEAEAKYPEFETVVAGDKILGVSKNCTELYRSGKVSHSQEMKCGSSKWWFFNVRDSWKCLKVWFAALCPCQSGAGHGLPKEAVADMFWAGCSSF